MLYVDSLHLGDALLYRWLLKVLPVAKLTERLIPSKRYIIRKAPCQWRLFSICLTLCLIRKDSEPSILTGRLMISFPTASAFS